jgi:mono/diheme cytochrome c family protein
MKIKSAVCGALLAMAMLLTMAAAAKTSGEKTSGDKTGDKTSAKETPATVAGTHSAQDDTLRLAGEKRFHSNCARCHASPPKFPPRMMATIVRHMRVRATITEQDMRLILHYMSE